jgi:hypothetical protein
VTHVAGSNTAVLTLSAPLTSSDFTAGTVAAATATSIYDDASLAMGTTPEAIRSSGVPVGADIFNFTEAASSATVWDDQTIVSGSVTDPSQSILGDGYFTGDGTNNKVTFANNNDAFLADSMLTLETKFKFTDPTNYFSGTGNKAWRIFERTASGNYQMSLWRNNYNGSGTNAYPTYNAPDGVVSIALWVRPVNSNFTGDGWTNVYKPVVTDYANYPIVANHWYKVRAVWNSGKTDGISGDHYFVPADIYVDDLGTDGNNTGENWSGFRNATKQEQYQIDGGKIHIGDTILENAGAFYAGGGASGNYFNGKIDYIKIDPSSLDYTGLDETTISSIEATDASGGGPGIQTGDQVIIRFNGATAGTPITSANIASALGLSNSHSWLDGQVPGQISSATWSTTTNLNDTLTITLSNLFGVPTVAPFDIVTLNGVLKNNLGYSIMDSKQITGSF